MREPVLFHVDMDAFYASVEQGDHPEWKGLPVIVGALPGGRGVVATCSYEARAFGVHSAMPINQAARLCPQAVFTHPRMERYFEVSSRVVSLLGNFTPVVRQISVDEARLDMTGTEGLFGTPQEAALKIKHRIFQDAGLTISIGVGPNAFLAKMASEENKPNGLFRVTRSEAEAWLAPKDAGKLPGVGKKTRDRLREIGVNTIGEIAKVSESSLKRVLGEAAGASLYLLARGIQPGNPDADPKEKSLSAETTFPQDVVATMVLNRTLLELSHQVFFRCLDQGYRSRVVQMKIRLDDFTTMTLRHTLGHWVSSGEELAGEVKALFRKKWNGQPVRLLGVGLGSLEPRDSDTQSDLFLDRAARHRKLEETVLRLKSRFSGQVLSKASLLKPEEGGEGS